MTFWVRSFWYQNNSWNFIPWDFTLSWVPGYGAFSFPEILPGGRRPVSHSVWGCEYIKQFFPVLGHPKPGCLLPAWAGRHGRKPTENWGFVCFNEHPGIFRNWALLAFLKDTQEVWMSLTLVTAYLSEVWDFCAHQGRVLVPDRRRGYSPALCMTWGDGCRITLTLVGVEDILGALSVLTHQLSFTLLTYLQFGKR